MNILIVNGPNLNMLGIREPEIYGSNTYKNLCSLIEDHADKLGVNVEIYQSNYEGDLVTKIQDAYFNDVDGIVVNLAAYTHTSVALLDAINAVSIPAVEVHISAVEERESFRKISYVRPACIDTIWGHGFQGYLEAMDLLVDLKKTGKLAAGEGKNSASNAADMMD